MDKQYNTHFEDAWVSGKITASERRILMTKWVGSAWSLFCAEYKNAIKASFVKCGIAVPIDGSEDSLINDIRGLNDYCIPPWKSNPVLNSEQPRREQSDILESDSENYTEGINDPGPGCTDGESDEEETELKRDKEVEFESDEEVELDEEEMDSEIKVGSYRRLRSDITLGDEIL